MMTMISETSAGDDYKAPPIRGAKKAGSVSESMSGGGANKKEKKQEDLSFHITKEEFLNIQFEYQWPRII